MKRFLSAPIILFVVFGLVIISLYYYWQENLKPVSSNTDTQTFIVQKGEGTKQIAKDLAEKKLIRNELVFVLLVKKLGLQNKIQAGDFLLSPSFSAEKIVKELTHGTLDTWVTIPEGWRDEEIAQRLEKELQIPQEDFLKVAKTGYMYPDTYLFPKTATAAMVADIMKKNFDNRIQSLEKDALKPSKKFMGLTLDEIVVLSSIVEREAKFEEDRPIIAGILLKRLENDWPLEVDATIQYALGFIPKENTWWKKHLTNDDLKIDSQFNSRKNRGLPPTPISNPGMAALKAVFRPQDSPYWFYLSDQNGKMHYAKTIEEHNNNISKYLD